MGQHLHWVLVLQNYGAARAAPAVWLSPPMPDYISNHINALLIY